MMKTSNRRGVVSISTFSFVILILIAILIFSYDFYTDSKDISLKQIKEQELLNSIASFRAELIQLSSNVNSTINYTNNLDSVDIVLNLNDDIISAKQEMSNEYIILNMSTLGLSFCSSANVSPSFEIVAHYNGSCIDIITS